MDTTEAIILSTQEGKEKYDAVLKQLLANRQILARILKRFVPEFEDCSIKDIEKDIFFGHTYGFKDWCTKNMTTL